MTVENFQDGKLITLSKPFDTRPKILNFFYFFSFFVSAGFFLSKLLVENLSIGLTFFLVSLAAVFFIASYRFANSSVQAEKIFINDKEFQIIRKGLFKNDVKTFRIAEISNFRYPDKPELTKHPLAGETFDYLGFETDQKVINEMYGDNRLAFDYEGKTISFGENIYSWDFDKLETLLHHVAGKNLHNTH